VKSSLPVRLLCVVSLLASVPALAVVPDAPTVTVSGAPRVLQFKWNYVPRANWYEVWFRANAGAAWVKYAEAPSWRPRADINVSVHLLDWRAARYRVAACNSLGCTNSSEIGVLSALPQTRLTLLPGPDFGELGWSVDVSEDGKRVVGNGSSFLSGAVYVYRKDGATWTREAILKASIEQPGAAYDSEVAINADGSVVALGLRSEDRNPADPESEGETGAVYLFRRTGTVWQLEQKLVVPNADYGEQFGYHVDLDASGNLLAAWRRTGGVSLSGGSVELYRHSGGGWVREALLPTFEDGDNCDGIALSGDGGTLVRDCKGGLTPVISGRVDVFRAPTWQRVAHIPHAAMNGNAINSVGISHDGNRFAIRVVEPTGDFGIPRPHVEIFGYTDGAWVADGRVETGAWMQNGDTGLADSRFGEAISMSRDGRFLAVGDWRDTAGGAGVLYPPIASSGTATGGVYVFERAPRGWRQRQFIKSWNPSSDWYGFSVSLGDNGRLLAVGAPYATGAGSISLY
jgi:trimeric autotransporter adhesin